MSVDLFQDLPRLRTGLGIDISGSYVAIVRARLARRGWTYETVFSGATTDPADRLRSALRDLQADLALGRTLMAAALPVSSSSSRWLTAPYASMAKAKRVLPALLDIELPLPLESCTYGFQPVQPDAGHVRALAIAAPQTGIDKRLAELQAWKLDPHVLDHEGIALWQQHRRHALNRRRGLQFIVYLGEDRTVWVAGEGDQFLGAQSTQSSYREIPGPATTGSTPTGAQSWSDRGLRFLRGWLKRKSESAPALYWVGPGAESDSVAALQDTLRDIEMEHHIHENAASFLAAALAANLLASDSKAINFRTGPQTHPLMRRLQQRRMYRLATLTGLAALLLASLNLGIGWRVQQRMERAEADIAERARRITGMAPLPRRQELTLARRTMTETEQAVRPIAAFFRRPLADELGPLLTLAHDQQWSIRALRMDTSTITLHGTAPNRIAVQAGVALLEADGWNVNRQIQTRMDTDRLDIHITGERSE